MAVMGEFCHAWGSAKSALINYNGQAIALE